MSLIRKKGGEIMPEWDGMVMLLVSRAYSKMPQYLVFSKSGANPRLPLDVGPRFSTCLSYHPPSSHFTETPSTAQEKAASLFTFLFCFVFFQR